MGRNADPGDDIAVFLIGAVLLVGVAYGLVTLLDLAKVFGSIQ